jgi:hypothetical protein
MIAESKPRELQHIDVVGEVDNGVDAIRLGVVAEMIGTGATDQRIAAAIATDRIVAIEADDDILARSAGERAVACCAENNGRYI